MENMTNQDIVKIGVDAYRGTVEKYSVSNAQSLLRQALIEANNGSSKLNYRAIRDGKCPGLFSIVEEILAQTAVEGLLEDELFNRIVDFRNIAEGDENQFEVEDATLFVVDDTAEGSQAVRRQRITDTISVSVHTTMHTVRIYEELSRVLSGRIDFNTMIDRVALSFRQKMLNDVYALWNGATEDDFGGQAFFPTAGSFDEEALLDVVAHVEAAAGGKPATIIGTKKAVRAIGKSLEASEAKNDLYNFGYCGKFYGTPVVATPQRHKVGTTDFVFNDNVLTIVAGDEKPIKFVYEGDPLVIMGDPTKNADLTQEYFYGERYGLALILAAGNTGVGRYQTT